MDLVTRRKWDAAARTFDAINSRGPLRRWAPVKREFYAPMRGRVLLAAVGTGLDIGFFPDGREIVAIDISPKMLARAKPRAEQYQGSLTLLEQDVRQLSFPDDEFDQVFTACTFCSVPDPVAGLKELHRVLKPGGELHMFEHTISRWFPFNMMLHLMTPVTRRLGPELNRDTPANVQRAGFRIREVRNVYLDVVKTIVAAPE